MEEVLGHQVEGVVEEVGLLPLLGVAEVEEVVLPLEVGVVEGQLDHHPSLGVVGVELLFYLVVEEVVGGLHGQVEVGAEVPCCVLIC